VEEEATMDIIEQPAHPAGTLADQANHATVAEDP